MNSICDHFGVNQEIRCKIWCPVKAGNKSADGLCAAGKNVRVCTVGVLL